MELINNAFLRCTHSSFSSRISSIKNPPFHSTQLGKIMGDISCHLVRITRIELARVASQDSKSCVSTNSTISACEINYINKDNKKQLVSFLKY